MARFERVCYYCLDYLNAEGYAMLRIPLDQTGALLLVPGNVRCDYCALREEGKMFVRPNWWK